MSVVKVHPVVFLGVSDFLKRSNGQETSVLLLFGSKQADEIVSTADIPLVQGAVDQGFLDGKLASVYEVNPEVRLVGYVAVGGGGNRELSAGLAQFIAGDEVVVLCVDTRDFAELGKAMKTRLVGWSPVTGEYDKKFRLESSEPEQAAISSIVNNQANDNLVKVLDGVVESKQESLQILEQKVAQMERYLTGSGPLDWRVVNEIGKVISYLEALPGAAGPAPGGSDLIGLMTLLHEGVMSANEVIQRG